MNLRDSLPGSLCRKHRMPLSTPKPVALSTIPTELSGKSTLYMIPIVSAYVAAGSSRYVGIAYTIYTISDRVSTSTALTGSAFISWISSCSGSSVVSN